MLNDIRFALRLLTKNPGFSTVAILTLALGIGANTAVFSVIDGVLLRRPPVVALDRLAMLWETDRTSGTTREPASVPDFLDFQQQSRSFAQMSAILASEVNLTPTSGDPVRLAALRVSAGLSPMLGIGPIVGRTFTEEEDRPGGPAVAQIGEALWDRMFARDPSIVGKTIRFDDEPYTIIGVMPASADFGVVQLLSSAAYARSFIDRAARSAVDVWLPLQPDPKTLPRETHPIFVLGRLSTGATITSAQQELTAITADLERTYPRANVGRGAFIESFDEVVFGRVRPALSILLGAVGLVLLAGCVNVANLLLARGASRAREIAVRAALGGGHATLARQFLIENLVLTLASAVAGVVAAYGGLRILVALAPADIPRLSQAAIDARVLGVALGVSTIVGLVFGMVPMFQARALDLQSALRAAGGGASSGPAFGRIRGALVIAQVALAAVLVIGAGLLIKSFWRVQQVDPGFRAVGVLKAEYQLPRSRYPVNFAVYPNFKEMHAFTDALMERARALPGVESAAIAAAHPLDPGFTNSFTIVGREAEARTWPEITVRSVSASYFQTVGVPLVNGRLLSDGDSTTAPPVAVINEAAATRFFPNASPLGARIRFWGIARTIVGVVGNERSHGVAEAAPVAVYAALPQAPTAGGAGVLLLRTSRDPGLVANDATSAIHAVDPGLAVFGVEPLVDTLARSVSERRFTFTMLCVFAGLALALAAVGVHGVLSFSVARRTRELAIRLALGARPALLRRLIVREALTLGAIGLGIGIALALGFTRVLRGLLFEVTPTDPVTFAAAVVVVLGTAIAASYAPARRATKADPNAALRAD